MANDIDIKVGASVEELDAGMRHAKESVEKFTESVKQAGEAGKKLAEIFGVSLTIAGITEFVHAMSELGLQTERTMTMLGLSAEQVGVLSGVARLTGTDVDRLALGIERMSLNIQRSTADGFNPAAQALKVLGLNAKEFIGLPTDQYILKLADAVSKFNPSLNLTNAIMAVGGRGIAQMIPFLHLGAEGFKQFEEEIKKTGSTLDDAQAKSFAQTHESLTLLGLSFQGLGIAIFTWVKPAIDWLTSTATIVVQDLKNWLVNADGAALAFSSFGLALETVFAKAKVVLPAIGFMLKNWLNFTMSQEEWKAGLRAADTSLKELSNLYLTRLDRLRVDAQTKVKDIFSTGGGLNAGALDFGAKNALDATIKGLDAQIKQYEAANKVISTILDARVKRGEITEAAAARQEIANLDTLTAAVLNFYNQEISAASGDAVKLQEIELKKTEFLAKQWELRVKKEQDALTKSTEEWKAAGDAILSSWNTQMRGLLAGTETFKEAVGKMLGDLLIKVIEFFEAIIVKRLAVALASSLGSPLELAGNMKGIAGDVGQAYAGFAAFYAPFLGPGALAAAAVDAAAVEGTALAFAAPAFETGAWEIPRTMMATIHQGEMIIPAGPAQSIRDGGGGASVHFNVSAIDGASVQSFFREHGSKIAAIVSDKITRNSSLRPAY